MRFSKALGQALGHVDTDNWQGRLDALHGQHRTWKAVAELLGVDKRTVERWRLGYVDKHGNRVHHSDKAVKEQIVPKVRAGWKADRKAQVQAVNWRDLSMVGSLQVADYPPRRENMAAGRYMSADAIADVAGAYVNGDDDAVDAAMDRFMSEEYTATGDAQLTDVSKLEF